MSSAFAAAAGLAANERLGQEFQKQFDALFADPAGNAEAIKLDLAKLTAWVARGIAMADRNDSADLEGSVYQHCLETLPRYLAGGYRAGVPAHDWFRKAINRRFWELTRHDLMVRKRHTSIDSVNEGIAGNLTHDPMAIARSTKRKTSFRLQGDTDTRAATRAIDHKITRAVRDFSLTKDERERYDLRASVATLQGIRWELVGSFRRVVTEGIGYSPSHRLHDITPPPAAAALDFFGHQTGEPKMDGITEAPTTTSTNAAPAPQAAKRSERKGSRLAGILAELAAGEHSTAALAKKFGVNVVRIRRDIQDLRAAGHDVVELGGVKSPRYCIGQPKKAPTAKRSTTRSASSTGSTARPAPLAPPVATIVPASNPRAADLLRALANLVELCSAA